MSDAQASGPTRGNLPRAQVRRPRFSVVWLIPILAAIIAVYLGYRTLMERGPLLTLTFSTADGLTAGQTQVQYKAVALGTVESIDLSRDHRNVIVGVRMNNVGARFLTDHARFWVVRPSFAAGNLSGLQTLVSGDYIAVDPGLPGGHFQTRFTGLEEPPGVRSDEPGQTYVLKADNIGSLGTGSPVFYRDVVVGEVLGYDIGNGLGPVTVSIFVRSPYDRLVRPESHFWNSSGISLGFQGGALHIEFQSLAALLAGGVTFDLPPEAERSAPSPDNAVFPLYVSEDAAEAAGYQRKIPIVAYFDSSVGGLARGASVDVLGIQVGEVTEVRLLIDLETAKVRVRVAMELQPQRIFKASILPPNMTLAEGVQKLVNGGLRVELATANYVTGQQVISLVMVPDTVPVKVTQEGNAFVLPSQGGAFDKLADSLSAISGNLSKFPFVQIGDNLNKLLLTANGTLGGRQMKQTLTELSETLRLTNTTLGGLDQGFGADSDFQRNLEQLMDQATDTLRSLDQLSSYLDRHPQSLLLGRGSQ
jgi:paraquat-inducible protein B